MISHMIRHMPESVEGRYVVRGLHGVELDSAGEPCEHCQTEGQQVETQIYGKAREGGNVFIESCWSCVPRALESENVEPGTIIEVEYSA